MKKYNVIVTQHNDEEYIFSYNIIPSPITKLWEKCIISAIENDKNLTCFSHIDCGSTYQNTLDQINYYCNKINKEGILIIKDVPKLIKECTQEFLNKLHKIFHMYTEKAHTLNLHNDTRTSLLVLNNLIHELDHMTTDKETSFNLVKMHFEDDHIYDIALADSHYPYFNYIWEGMGYLRLGYATLGKTLHACYIENDIMGSVKGNKFWLELIEYCMSEYGRKERMKIYNVWKGRFVLQTTGPKLISRFVRMYYPEIKPLKNVVYTKWNRDSKKRYIIMDLKLNTWVGVGGR